MNLVARSPLRFLYFYVTVIRIYAYTYYGLLQIALFCDDIHDILACSFVLLVLCAHVGA